LIGDVEGGSRSTSSRRSRDESARVPARPEVDDAPRTANSRVVRRGSRVDSRSVPSDAMTVAVQFAPRRTGRRRNEPSGDEDCAIERADAMRFSSVTRGRAAQQCPGRHGWCRTDALERMRVPPAKGDFTSAPTSAATDSRNASAHSTSRTPIVKSFSTRRPRPTVASRKNWVKKVRGRCRPESPGQRVRGLEQARRLSHERLTVVGILGIQSRAASRWRPRSATYSAIASFLARRALPARSPRLLFGRWFADPDSQSREDRWCRASWRSFAAVVAARPPPN